MTLIQPDNNSNEDSVTGSLLFKFIHDSLENATGAEKLDYILKARQTAAEEKEVETGRGELQLEMTKFQQEVLSRSANGHLYTISSALNIYSELSGDRTRGDIDTELEALEKCIKFLARHKVSLSSNLE